MRILIATQCFAPDVGGIESLMTGLAAALAGRGHRVLVCADRRRGLVAAADSGYPFTIVRFGGPRPWRRQRKARYINRLLQRDETDALITDSWKSLELLLPGPALRVLCLAHGMEYPLSATGTKRRRIRQTLARATGVIANSRYTADRLSPYQDGSDATAVIAPGVPVPPAPGPALRARVEQALSGRRPRLISVARLQAHKGIDTVLATLPALLSEYPQLVYVILGAGPDRERLLRLIAEYGVREHVLLAGNVGEDERGAWLAASDLFVLPGRPVADHIEGFGIAFLEAAWQGLPAVAGASGGGADAVQDGETGLVVNGEDAGAVRAAISTLLADESRRRALGAAAAARARQFDWALLVRRYEALLQDPPSV